MDGKWDLSFLYESFEDEAFLRDMAALPGAIRAQRDILEDKSLDDLARLEQLVRSGESLSALADRLGSFIFLTQAVDAENERANLYGDKLSLLMNDARLVDSDITRYVGSVANL